MIEFSAYQEVFGKLSPRDWMWAACLQDTQGKLRLEIWVFRIIGIQMVTEILQVGNSTVVDWLFLPSQGTVLQL